MPSKTGPLSLPPTSTRNAPPTASLTLSEELKHVIQKTGSSNVSTSLYDTAWLLRTEGILDDLQPTVDWLLESQLPDGSFANSIFSYSHDRVVCTLAVTNALLAAGVDVPTQRVERAAQAILRYSHGLSLDAMATVGFELIVPTLLREAEDFGLFETYEFRGYNELETYRQGKLNSLPRGLINRYVTPAFSAEMVGEHTDILDLDLLQEPNGSIGLSPSATAFFVNQIDPTNEAAIAYLKAVSTAGYTYNFSPFEIFETAWVLWNLSLLETVHTDPYYRQLLEPHVTYLAERSYPTGFSKDYSTFDSDDTSLALDVLMRFGPYKTVEETWDILRIFEAPDYFHCYLIESNPSISANIHILGALRSAGFSFEHPAAQKIVNFLSLVREANTYWYDKWHISPYYATSHAVISLLGLDELVNPALEWLIETQYDSGAWGYYQILTVEETAYCLQALLMAYRHGYRFDGMESAIHEGIQWVYDNYHAQMKPGAMYNMWLVKSLYSPHLVVQASTISALCLYEEILG